MAGWILRLSTLGHRMPESASRYGVGRCDIVHLQPPSIPWAKRRRFRLCKAQMMCNLGHGQGTQSCPSLLEVVYCMDGTRSLPKTTLVKRIAYTFANKVAFKTLQMFFCDILLFFGRAACFTIIRRARWLQKHCAEWHVHEKRSWKVTIQFLYFISCWLRDSYHEHPLLTHRNNPTPCD